MKNNIKAVSLSCALLWMLAALLSFSGCAKGDKPQVTGKDAGAVQLTGRTSITSQELQQATAEGQKILLLDVRSEGEYAGGHIPDAVLMPLPKVISTPGEVPWQKGQIIVVYCASGYRSVRACAALRQSDFPHVLHLKGDMDGWLRDGLPVATARP